MFASNPHNTPHAMLTRMYCHVLPCTACPVLPAARRTSSPPSCAASSTLPPRPGPASPPPQRVRAGVGRQWAGGRTGGSCLSAALHARMTAHSKSPRSPPSPASHPPKACSPSRPSCCCPTADLVALILSPDLSRRASAEAILQHPWLHSQGVAPDRPLDSVVISRLRNFAGMTRLRKAAILAAASHLRWVASGVCVGGWEGGASAGGSRGGLLGWPGGVWLAPPQGWGRRQSRWGAVHTAVPITAVHVARRRLHTFPAVPCCCALLLCPAVQPRGDPRPARAVQVV